MLTEPISKIATLVLELVNSGRNAILGKTCEKMHFQTINTQDVTSISVHDSKVKNPSSFDGIELIRLNNTENIENVFDFLLSRKGKWRANPLGVPVGRYCVIFWQESNRLSSISFGQSFFVGQGCGYFFANDASVDEIFEFQNIIGFNVSLSFES